MLTATTDGALDDVGRGFGPHEWRGMTVPVDDVGLDVANERADGVEGAATDRLAGQDAEPRLDHVEPRSPFGREVEVDARMRGEPGLHRGRGMRRGIIEHDMQLAAPVAPGETL